MQPDTITAIIADIAGKGPALALLIAAVIYFYKRQTKLEAAVEASTLKLEKYMAEDRETLLTAINNNTAAMKEMVEYIETVKH